MSNPDTTMKIEPMAGPEVKLLIEQLTRQLQQSDAKCKQLQAQQLTGGLKPPKPSKFNGVERHYAAAWIDTMERYFTVCGTPDNAARIDLVTSYLEKEASIWWSSVIRSNKILTWAQFRKVFLLNYQPVDAQREAAQKIQRLTQRASVKAFVELYRREVMMLDTTKYPEAVLKDMFVSKLQYETQAALLAADLTNMTLEAVMAKAQAIDGALWSAKQNTRPSGDRKGGFNGKYNGGSGLGSSPNHPIELGAVSAASESEGDLEVNAVGYGGASGSTKKLNKLTPEEREKCRREGRCFKCRQTGHMANTCTQFPKKV